jgi:FkbM family methyltransferase
MQPKLMRRMIALSWLYIRRRTPDLRGKQWFSRILARLLGPVPLRSPDGLWLNTRLSSAMDLSFLDPAGGGHDLIREAIAKLQPGEKMLDVGANTGLFSLLASKRVGPTGLVIAIEPSQREFQQLLTNLRLNQAINVLALNLASGEHAAISQLTLEPDHTGLNRIETGNHRSGSHQPCQVLPLAVLQLGQLALAKIDTEGYEVFTLRGLEPLLRQQTIQRLVVEISPTFLEQHQQTAADIYRLMARHGYCPTLGPLNERQWDELFVANRL